MRTARELINEAAGMWSGEPRQRVLHTALDRLAADGDRDTEAAGIALAMLAQEDATLLPEADAALRRAEAEGTETSWILVHLAEAAYAAGVPDTALDYATAVRAGYFAELDIRWRAVRMDELRAAALLLLGRFHDATRLAAEVCADLARFGDDDDLSPPAQLAQAALRCAGDLARPDVRAAGCEVVRLLCRSLDVEEWFSAGLAAQLHAARRTCEH